MTFPLTLATLVMTFWAASPLSFVSNHLTDSGTSLGANKAHVVKSHEVDSLWGPERNSGEHIIKLFKKYF